MSKYSILFEADRFHEIGPFRFPIFEDLTPGEAKGIEALAKAQAKSTYRSMRLAKRIAADRGIEVKDALDILSEIGDEKHEKILFEYVEDIEALSEDSISATEQKIQYVTLFMKFRGEVKFPGEDIWTKTSDWTEEDTEAILSKKVLDEIFQMILWERDGWPTETKTESEGKEPVAVTPRRTRTST